MVKEEFDYMIYLLEKLDRAAEIEAIRQVAAKTGSKPEHLVAEVQGSHSDYGKFDLHVKHTKKKSVYESLTIDIDDILD